MSPHEFKIKIERDIKENPFKYINHDVVKASNLNFRTLSLENVSSAIEIEFASDEKIAEYLQGKDLGVNLCCIVCIKILGLHQCAVPHNGPCNMC